jgi:Domain of unknown function (DUF4062)
MPSTVTLYRIFVASPADCRREREIVRRAVGDWNVAYGYPRAVMLEAVLWETHAYPALGARPQEIINRQIVDTCDLALALFRARLGSPSGPYLSGTVEEIERFHARRQPTLVYFHEPPRPADASDPAVQELQAYRTQVSSCGLVWRYRGIAEFATLVARHLALTMSPLVGSPPDAAGVASVRPEPAPPPPATAPADPQLAAMRDLRERTTLLWESLIDLPAGQTDLDTEIREVTLRRVRPSLDALEADGLMHYDVEKVYVMDWDAMPVFRITITGIGPPLRQLVSQAAQ